MKLLVTGAAGFLGTALVERLIEHNYTDIRCNVRRSADIPKLESLSRQHPNVNLEFCVGNLRYRDHAARAVDDVELIFHLAAGKKGTAADLFLDTVVASRNLLDAVADRKPMRIVLVSSFAVYGVAGLRRGAYVNEQTPMETHPEWRDHYSHAKLRQEQLFWDYQQRNSFELVVLRPGVIYGPEGSHFSNRVGLSIGKWKLHLGGNSLLPLSYVTNCAEAIVVAGTHDRAAGEVYNVLDNDLLTCRKYLRTYKKDVSNIPSLSVPYFGVKLLAAAVAKYHRYSKGQLPAILTPYKAASAWKAHRFDNSKLRATGWTQLVTTAEGIRQSFAAFRTVLNTPSATRPMLQASTNRADATTVDLPPNSQEFVAGAVLDATYNDNFDHLLGAFARLLAAGQNARLIVFGSPDARHVGNSTANTTLSAHLDWVPGEPSTRNVLEACDVLISLQDGIPPVVLRAISSHIPVITTAVHIPEVLRKQPTLICIDKGDKNAVYNQLLRLAQQPKRKRLDDSIAGNGIAKYYSETYLWREFLSQTANGLEPNGHALVKRLLFSAVPSRQLLEHGNRERPQIALTIDDGPDPVFTPRILDILRDRAIKATFFVVGGSAEQYPDLVLRMKSEGHDVGNHSYSHPYFHRLSWTDALREIRMTQSVLGRILGEECNLFRPPHGKLALRSLLPAWAAGQQIVMWNVDLKDYCASAGQVESRLGRTSFSSGDVILYHGTSEAALKALPHVIEAALAGGRQAATVSELMSH